jgi:hypothetical protein
MSQIFRRDITIWLDFFCVTIKNGLISLPRLKKKSQGCFNDSQPHPRNFASMRFFIFLALDETRHPVMIRLMMLVEGLPPRFSHAELEQFAQAKALVVLHPPAGWYS